jgi:hypothetical protein
VLSVALAALCGAWLVTSPVLAALAVRRRHGTVCRCPQSRAGTFHYPYCRS